MANERYPLRQVILDDLTGHNKVALVLLVLVVFSGLSTVWITHQTRLLATQLSRLTSENRKLQSDYTHLQLEENSQVYKLRDSGEEEKKGLHPIQKGQEIILVR